MCLTLCLNVCVVTGTTRTAGREEQGLAEMKHEVLEMKSVLNIHKGAQNKNRTLTSFNSFFLYFCFLWTFWLFERRKQVFPHILTWMMVEITLSFVPCVHRSPQP